MNDGNGSVRDLARRYVREAIGAGTGEWLLDGLTRDEALAMARGRPSAGEGRGGIGGSADGSRPPGADASAPLESGPIGGAKAPTERAAVDDAAIEGAEDLAALSRLVASCTRCPLHSVRRNPVFGEGAADARVVCVGEAPGRREDETGRPFVGRAGQLLDRLLLTIGLPREQVYICNVLKSRPPRNRDPLPEEVRACSPFLLRQLALIRPEIIVAFGAFAARTLLESSSALGRMRGSVHRYAGYPVVVTYHPAALLRNPGWIRPTWEDLQIVRRILDGETPGGGHG